MLIYLISQILYVSVWDFYLDLNIFHLHKTYRYAQNAH